MRSVPAPESAMIELKHDALVFSFPEVHRDAVLRVEFQRTMRLPPGDLAHALPALGRLPLHQVHDADHALPAWIARGGIMLPVHTADALWLAFTSPWEYPFAVQVAVGRKDAPTGRVWRDGLSPAPQNYLVVPQQRTLTGWFDGWQVHQFGAVPREEGAAGGFTALHVAVQPMRRSVHERRTASADPASPVCYAGALEANPAGALFVSHAVVDDPCGLEDWDAGRRARCLVYLATAAAWSSVTGSQPPTDPLTADDYARSRIPWLEEYAP